ncbi:MAG: hypothetical protein QNJ69_06675 [Gammaproteobacteria bacterium]|nr:hypothetical protein [Gammaproteobacteria bacterium]
MTATRSLRAYAVMLVLAVMLTLSIYQLLIVTMHHLLTQELGSWQGKDYAQASYDRWQNQQVMVDTLVFLAPYHGEVLQSSSRFYQLGARIVAASNEHQHLTRQHQQQSLQLIRLSLLKQPGWPLAWMDLAFIKSSQLQFDEEFQQAFALALTHGAAEEYILLGMTEIGFAYWRDLSRQNRQQFLSFLDLAVARQPQHVISNASFYRRSYVICRLLQNDNPLLTEYCASNSQTDSARRIAQRQFAVDYPLPVYVPVDHPPALAHARNLR